MWQEHQAPQVQQVPLDKPDNLGMLVQLALLVRRGRGVTMGLEDPGDHLGTRGLLEPLVILVHQEKMGQMAKWVHLAILVQLDQLDFLVTEAQRERVDTQGTQDSLDPREDLVCLAHQVPRGLKAQGGFQVTQGLMEHRETRDHLAPEDFLEHRVPKDRRVNKDQMVHRDQ